MYFQQNNEVSMLIPNCGQIPNAVWLTKKKKRNIENVYCIFSLHYTHLTMKCLPLSSFCHFHLPDIPSWKQEIYINLSLQVS